MIDSRPQEVTGFLDYAEYSAETRECILRPKRFSAVGEWTMIQQTRMSPLTAFFLGLFSCGGILIISLAAVALCGMKMAERNISGVIHFAGEVLDGLPELLEELPPTLADALNDRRAPDYAGRLQFQVKFVEEGQGRVCPVLTLTNSGDEVVSLLSVRVAALNPEGLPLRDWTEVVATPIAIDDDWRGPMMPHATRYVTLRCTRKPLDVSIDSLQGAVELSDVRVWQPKKEPATVAVR